MVLVISLVSVGVDSYYEEEGGVITLNRQQLEHIYQLGLKDGIEGREYMASLPSTMDDVREIFHMAAQPRAFQDICRN